MFVSVPPEVLRRDRERKKRLQAPITRALLSDNALFAEVSRARGAAEVEEDELLAADDDGAAADVGEAAADGDDDMYGDLGGGDDDMYGDLGGADDAGGDAPAEEAIDQNAAELPVVQALGQLEAHSSRRPRRAERRAAAETGPKAERVSADCQAADTSRVQGGRRGQARHDADHGRRAHPAPAARRRA